MGELYLDRADASLELAGKVLSVRVPDAPVRKLPAALLERIIVRADTRLSTGVLAGLAELGVGVLMLHGRRGERVASVVGVPGKDVRLRITQVRRLDDAAFRVLWCRRLVRSKLAAQRRLLVRAMAARADLRKPLFDALQTLDGCKGQLDGCDDVAALRGLEGAAAAAWFRAYACLFADSLGFGQRRRRPPPDPVNACLSLGYTLLYGLAIQASHARGMDPMIGYLHAPCSGRASLACDLMEPWRPRVDALVWYLFRTRQLEAAHFGRDGSGACLLGKAGRSTFYAAWAVQARRLHRLLGRHARLAASALGDLAPADDDPEEPWA